jgi:glc operon protein GlcG
MRFLKFALVAGSMLAAVAASALTPAPPAPPAPPAAGGTPDKVPADIPYGQSR